MTLKIISWSYDIVAWLFSKQRVPNMIVVCFVLFLRHLYLWRPPQWTVCGTSGPAGVPARPPAPTGPCRGPESVTAPPTEAPSAEESGWRLSTASSENARVSRSSSVLCLTDLWRCSSWAGSNMDKVTFETQKKIVLWFHEKLKITFRKCLSLSKCKYVAKKEKMVSQWSSQISNKSWSWLWTQGHTDSYDLLDSTLSSRSFTFQFPSSSWPSSCVL